METFTNEFINALRDGGIRSFKDRYRSTDILLIDDIQSLQGREQTQEEFFHTFNALHDSGKQIVISSDRPPKAIATLEDRLRSRFEMGLITDVQPPDLETRIAILQKRVRADRYADPRPRGAAVHRRAGVHERARARGRAHPRRRPRVHLRPPRRPSRSPARSSRTSSPPRRAPSASSVIQGEVCRYYRVTLDELTSDKRTRRIVGPRQVAMYLSRELTDASLPAIGRAFGGRDHTTVMYAVQKVADQMAGEGEVLTAVQALTGRLTGKRERSVTVEDPREGACPHSPPSPARGRAGRRAGDGWGTIGTPDGARRTGARTGRRPAGAGLLRALPTLHTPYDVDLSQALSNS